MLTPLRSAFGSAAFEFGRQSAGGGSNGSTTPGLVHLSSGSMPAPVHAKAADLAPSGDLPAPPTLALALLAFAGAARGARARGRNARLRPTVHALVLTLTLAVLAAPAPAQPGHAPVTKAAFGATAADVEAFLNWAERSYPQYFPGPQPSRTLEPYVYRQYAASGNYLGVADGSVYVLAPLVASTSTPVRVGRVADYECEVHPARCKPRRVAGSLLIDVASDLRTRAAMESFLGGPLLATWNPTDAAGPGIKIMMFGAVPGCPEGERGPMGTFADAQLAAAGYRGAATAVDAAMRFEAKPHAGCGFAASGRHGPSLVFADGAELWLATSTLDGPEDLLRPFAPGGQNGLGNNVRVLNTSVNYRLAHPFAPLQVFASNGVARVSTVLQLARLQAGTGSGGLTQAKQQIALILSNQRCSATHPGRLCMIHYLFALGIAQSGVSDWSAVDWAQGAAIWADPVMSNMPVVDVALVPPAGTTGVQRETRLPLYTSRGAATQHAPFEPLLFAVDRRSTAPAVVRSPPARRQPRRELGQGRQPAAWRPNNPRFGRMTARRSARGCGRTRRRRSVDRTALRGGHRSFAAARRAGPYDGLARRRHLPPRRVGRRRCAALQHLGRPR